MRASWLRSLWVCARKEARLLLRDREGLAVLFLMPVLFVVIMSLALHDFFKRDAAPRFDLIVLDADQDRLSRDFQKAMTGQNAFRTEFRTTRDWPAARDELRLEMAKRRGAFAVVFPPDTTRRYAQVISVASSGALSADAKLPSVALEFITDPTIRSDHRALAKAMVERIAASLELRELVRRFGGVELPMQSQRAAALLEVIDAPQPVGVDPERRPIRATATQQNVPAYVLLAMFMLVVPLSGTLIRERTQGSLMRLRSMPVSGSAIIGGKIAPYIIINLLQVALCLAIGRWLLPLFGTDALQFGQSPSALIILSIASSLAAIGFGLGVASIARTPEQATSFGATAVLIMAALGGVMVPTVMMPDWMERIGALSPIRWGLDGYLELFVRDATLADIAPRAAALAVFGGLCLALAVFRFNRDARP